MRPRATALNNLLQVATLEASSLKLDDPVMHVGGPSSP